MTLTQISSRGVEDALRWSLGASGTDHYTFTGPGLTGTVNDPAIYLTRGQTYIFENNNSSNAHPFYIKTSFANGGTNDQYSTGVTNNGGAGGTEIKFTVPHDSPDVLYYQCSSHAMMYGQLNIAGSVANGSITTAKLAADAVDGTKLADNAVAAEHIADDAIEAAQLDNNSVTAAAIAADAVGTSEIADQAVTLAKLEHGTGSNDGKFLRANNGADPSFETVSIPAGTTLNGNTDHQVMTGTGTANTLQGEATFTHNPSTYDTTIIHNANAPSDLIIQNDSSGTAANARLTIQSGSNANAGAMLQFVTGSDSWSLLTPKTAGALDFNDNGSLAFKMAGSGNFDVITGDVTINGSGKGIDFAHGANTGTAANILDEYEEGTWTPTLNSAPSGASLANDTGYYTKVGNVCTIWLQSLAFSGNNSSGNTIHIGGLPFTPAGDMTAHGIARGYGVYMNGSHSWVPFVDSTNQMTFGQLDESASWTSLKYSGLQNTSNVVIQLTLTYRTT